MIFSYKHSTTRSVPISVHRQPTTIYRRPVLRSQSAHDLIENSLLIEIRLHINSFRILLSTTFTIWRQGILFTPEEN